MNETVSWNEWLFINLRQGNSRILVWLWRRPWQRWPCQKKGLKRSTWAYQSLTSHKPRPPAVRSGTICQIWAAQWSHSTHEVKSFNKIRTQNIRYFNEMSFKTSLPSSLWAAACWWICLVFLVAAAGPSQSPRLHSDSLSLLAPDMWGIQLLYLTKEAFLFFLIGLFWLL